MTGCKHDNRERKKSFIIKCKTSHCDVNEKQHKTKINITRIHRHYF